MGSLGYPINDISLCVYSHMSGSGVPVNLQYGTILDWAEGVGSEFCCFQYTYTSEFIVQKHYLYHDIQTQLHLVI